MYFKIPHFANKDRANIQFLQAVSPCYHSFEYPPPQLCKLSHIQYISKALPLRQFMLIEVLKSKIHNVKITFTELNYIGSITIDEDLLDAANMIENEKVLIVNNNNGERLETYIIKGERGSGKVGLNGSAARKGMVGDELIIISFATMEMEEAKQHKPWLVFPNKFNKL